MGGTGSKNCGKGDVIDESDGFHVLELHSPSLGAGIGAVFAVIAVVVIGYFLIRRFCKPGGGGRRRMDYGAQMPKIPGAGFNPFQPSFIPGGPMRPFPTPEFLSIPIPELPPRNPYSMPPPTFNAARAGPLERAISIPFNAG